MSGVTGLPSFVVGCFEIEEFDSHTLSWESPQGRLPFADLLHQKQFSSLSDVERKFTRSILCSAPDAPPPQWSGKWVQEPWTFSTSFSQPFDLEPHLSDTVRRRKWTQTVVLSNEKTAPRRLSVLPSAIGLIDIADDIEIDAGAGESSTQMMSASHCEEMDEQEDTTLSRDRFSVRGTWQNAAAVTSCTGCNTNFSEKGNNKKIHCVGCGLVFCKDCCRKEPSVASRRVCRSCVSSEISRLCDSASVRSSCSATSESPTSRRGSVNELSQAAVSQQQQQQQPTIIGSFQDVIFENERLFPGIGWGIYRLPTDFPRFSDELGTVERGFEASDAELEKQNGEWQGEWEIDVVPRKTDAEGWMYGWHFETPVSELQRRQKMPHLIRRRRWRRSANILSGGTERHSVATDCRATLQIFQFQRLLPAIGWTGNGLPRGRPEFSDRTGINEAKLMDVEREIRTEHPACRLMLQQWIVDKDERTSDEGWSFSPDFDLDPELWSRTMRRGDSFRKRIWTNIVDASSSAALLCWSSKLKMLLSGTEAADAISAAAAAGTSPQETREGESSPKATASSAHVKFVVFENERKFPFAGFTTKRLPTDRPHFSNAAGTMEREKSQVENELPQDAFLWEDDTWSLVITDATDAEGWSYAINYCFDFSSVRRPRHCVRRRAWSRIAKPIDGSLSMQQALPPRLLAIATVFDTSTVVECDETQGSPSAGADALSCNVKLAASRREIIYYRTAYDSATLCGTCFEPFSLLVGEKQKRHCRSCGRLHCSACCKVESLAQFSRVCRACFQVLLERQIAEEQGVSEQEQQQGDLDEQNEPVAADIAAARSISESTSNNVAASVPTANKTPAPRSCCSIC